jgi:hypothetical protein
MAVGTERVNNGLTNINVYSLAVDPKDAGHALCRTYRWRPVQKHDAARTGTRATTLIYIIVRT